MGDESMAVAGRLLELRNDRGRLRRGAALGGFVILCVVAGVVVVVRQVGVEQPALGWFVAAFGALVVAYFLWETVGDVRKLLDRRAKVVIDDRGLANLRPPTWRVSWDEIATAELTIKAPKGVVLMAYVELTLTTGDPVFLDIRGLSLASNPSGVIPERAIWEAIDAALKESRSHGSAAAPTAHRP